MQNIRSSSITSISYKYEGGGKGEGSSSFVITKNSVIYISAKYTSAFVKTIKEKTREGLWDSLLTSINLKDFDEIKSNPERAASDGIDFTISITDAEKVHSCVNGNEDTINFEKIIPFINIMNNEVNQYILK